MPKPKTAVATATNQTEVTLAVMSTDAEVYATVSDETINAVVTMSQEIATSVKTGKPLKSNKPKSTKEEPQKEDKIIQATETTTAVTTSYVKIIPQKSETVAEIPLSELHPPEFHPFHVNDDEAMAHLADNSLVWQDQEKTVMARPLVVMNCLSATDAKEPASYQNLQLCQ